MAQARKAGRRPYTYLLGDAGAVEPSAAFRERLSRLVVRDGYGNRRHGRKPTPLRTTETLRHRGKQIHIGRVRPRTRRGENAYAD